MTITAIAVTRNDSSGSLQIPRPLAVAVAVDTGDAKGIALTQASDQGPAAIVTLTGTAAWTWSDVDSVTAANGQVVPAGVPWPVQCTPGKTQNFYIKTATTANIVATIIA